MQQRVVFAMIIVVPDDVQFQRFLVRNVVLLADVPHGRDGLFELFDAFEQRLVERLRRGQRGDRDAFAVFARSHVLPDFLA